VRILDVRRDRATLIVLVLLAGAIYALLPFAVGILSALVLCLLTASLYDRLKRHMPGGLATTIIILLMLGLVILPMTWLVMVLTGQAQEVFQNAQRSPELAAYARLKVAGVDLGTRATQASGAALKWGSGKALELAICCFQLPLQVSNLDSPDPESGVLPVTPRGKNCLAMEARQ
jgi:predicted PurR-regulated permease PerM